MSFMFWGSDVLNLLANLVEKDYEGGVMEYIVLIKEIDLLRYVRI